MSRNSTPLDASRSTDTLPPSQQWQLGNLQINCKPGTQMDIPVHKGMITAAKAIKPHPGFLSAVLLNSPVNQKTTSNSCNDANTLISHAVNPSPFLKITSSF